MADARSLVVQVINRVSPGADTSGSATLGSELDPNEVQEVLNSLAQEANSPAVASQAGPDTTIDELVQIVEASGS